MSKSRMYKVPSDVAVGVIAELAKLQEANPIIAMGVDARRAKYRALRKHLSAHKEIKEILHGLSANPAHLPTEARQLLQKYTEIPAVRELLDLCAIARAHSMVCASRRATFSTMVTQLLQEALHMRSLHKSPTIGGYPQNLKGDGICNSSLK